MTANPRQTLGFDRRDLIWAVGLIVLAIVVRTIAIGDDWLWYDELLSVNFANHDLLDVLLTVARFDVHPPLYYLQLSLWMTFGTSDTYLMANAVLWSVVAVAIVYTVARNCGGHSAAVIAGAFLAVAPAAVLYSHQVRMYSFATALLVASFAFLLRFLRGGSIVDLGLSTLMLCGVAYSHAAGIFMGTGVFAFGALRALRTRQWRQFRSIAVSGVILILACLPAIGFVANRGITHAMAPGWDSVAATIAFLLFGVENPLALTDQSLLRIAAVALTIMLIGSLRSTEIFATTVIVPIVVILVVSHVVTPIWLDRTVVFSVPFIALSIGLWLGDTSGRRGTWSMTPIRRTVAALFVTATLIASVEQQARYRKGDDFKPVARIVAGVVRPGDVLLLDVPAYSAWSFLWYFAGSEWGRPLDFHDVNPTWRHMLDQIGPEWTRRLRWAPTVRAYTVRGITVTASFLVPPPSLGGGTILVVRPSGSSRTSPAAGYRAELVERHGNLTVERWLWAAGNFEIRTLPV